MPTSPRSASACRRWRISGPPSPRPRAAARRRRAPPKRPYDENDETNIAYNQNKRECYQRYAQLSDHKVEAVWIPFADSALPAWFHLPPGYGGGRIPCVIAIPGMDSFKEIAVALYGDRWLARGIAVLAIDGPGQYEARILGI